jgi:transcription elongation GreA/GreB family factor
VADAMSRAFVKEHDADPGVLALPDRPVSPHRNLVTRRGLRLIERKVARQENDLARAIAAADREALGRAARELRYWTARLASAEVAEPDPESDHLVFGMAVTVLREDQTEATFRIVGEDEADPSTGRIAWTAPVVQALLGSRPGDLRQLPTGEVEVLSISGTPEALE